MKNIVISTLILSTLLFTQSCNNDTSNVESSTTTTDTTSTTVTASNTTEAASDTTASNSKPSYKKLTPEEANNIMQSGEDFILLDVRTEEEHAEIRIDDSLLIPDTEINTRAENELQNKDATILVYCRSGRRSELASRDLIDLGYTNVYDIGGIIDWPYETVSN